MAIQTKTFVTYVDLTKGGPDANPIPDINEAMTSIDIEANNFFKDKHWSQTRDIFDDVTQLGTLVVVKRTVVYTTEQITTGAPLSAAAALGQPRKQ